MRKVQVAYCSERLRVPSSVIDCIEVAASVGSARKKKAALEWSSIQIISDTEKTFKNLDKARLAFEMAIVREKTLRGQLNDVEVEPCAKRKDILNGAKASEMHWRDIFSVVGTTHAVERRTALVELGKTSWNESFQRAHATCARNTGTISKVFVKKVKAEKNELTAQ